MADQVKNCKVCGEEIKATAKRCPHCTSYLSYLNIPIIIAIIGAALLLWSSSMASHNMKRETLYTAENKLVVLDTIQKYSKEDCGTYIVILGKLKNQTDKAWTDLHFEVRFFNDKNELVDTLNSQLYSVVVGPRQESDFRIREKAAAPENQYKRYKIKISKAQEDFRFF